MASDRNDPYNAFNFVLSVEGMGEVAGFSECSGITSETDIIEYRNGDEEIRVRKIPGLRKFTNITLKRGIVGLQLWDWRKTVMGGKTERKAGSITLQNEAREAVIRWTFQEGWPSKWEGPSLNAKNNETAVETLEIAVEELLMEKVD